MSSDAFELDANVANFMYYGKTRLNPSSRLTEIGEMRASQPLPHRLYQSLLPIVWQYTKNLTVLTVCLSER